MSAALPATYHCVCGVVLEPRPSVAPKPQRGLAGLGGKILAKYPIPVGLLTPCWDSPIYLLIYLSTCLPSYSNLTPTIKPVRRTCPPVAVLGGEELQRPNLHLTPERGEIA